MPLLIATTGLPSGADGSRRIVDWERIWDSVPQGVPAKVSMTATPACLSITADNIFLPGTTLPSGPIMGYDWIRTARPG